MKKVLFMLSSMNIGGVEKSFLSLLSKIPKDKYKITLLLLEKKGGFLELIPDWVTIEEATWFKELKPIIMQPPQQTILDYKMKHEFIKIPTFIYSYILSEKLFKDRHIYYKHVFKVIPEHEDTYDIAISYQGPTETIDYYIANRVKAKKKISWIHFDVSKHQINRKLYTKLYREFDNIFVVSHEGKEKLNERIPSIRNKVAVFKNIISTQLINKMSEVEIDFEENYKGIKIVTVGRLTKEKGQDLAIKILARLRDNGYEVRWYCIGEGEHRKEYENLIEQYGLKKDFLLIGAKTNPYPFIKKSDIYVQTSRHEGYCLTLAEARCLNKPIVTTDFTGVKEQIVNNDTGLIVSFNEDELYLAVKELINNPHLRQQFSNKLLREQNETIIKEEKIAQLI
ncbi:glycosyltransferase [Virgibacillus oceani]